MNVDVSKLAFLIDDEQRTLGNAVIRAIRAVSLRHFAFGMEVAEKIVGNATEALGPGGVAGNAVD